MKYSQKLVWRACEEIWPDIVVHKKHGITCNLVSTLDTCVKIIFLWPDNMLVDLDKQVAKHLIKLALLELKQNGEIVFGEVNDYRFSS